MTAIDLNRHKEMLLCLVGVFTFILLLLLLKVPFEFIIMKFQDNELHGDMWAGVLSRLFIIFFGFFLIKRLRLMDVNGFGKKWELANIQALLIPIVIFTISIVKNSGRYAEAGWQTTLLFLLLTMMIGFAEELIFRGVMFPLLVKANYNRASNIMIGALITSLCFGILHYINIFKDMENPANFSLVTSQVVVAFCTGMAFNGIFLRVRNIIPIAIIHGLFNFAFGTSKISQGALETTATTSNPVDLTSLIFTLVLWLLIMGSGILMILISDKDHFLKKIGYIKSISLKNLST